MDSASTRASPWGCYHLILKGEEHAGEPGGSEVLALRGSAHLEPVPHLRLRVLLLTLQPGSGGHES